MAPGLYNKAIDNAHYPAGCNPEVEACISVPLVGDFPNTGLPNQELSYRCYWVFDKSYFLVKQNAEWKLLHSWRPTISEGVFNPAPNTVFIQGEVYNKQDDLMGKESEHCVFQDFFVKGPGGWIPFSFEEQDKINADPNAWEVDLINPTKLEMWDKFPNQ